MAIALLVCFIIGYVCIAAEHAIRIDKAATAIITGTLCWVILVVGSQAAPAHLSEEFAALGNTDLGSFFDHRLLHHLQDIAGILLFLMGAMTIVEIIDAHDGFSVITNRIQTTSKRKMLWIVSLLAFFLSAALDNLTTAIVMVSLCKKLIDDQRTRWLFAGVIVIAANAGGAWSPIGDVTTTMLWIGKQITAGQMIQALFLPALISLLIPLAVLSFTLKGEINKPKQNDQDSKSISPVARNVAFYLGLGGLLFVPVFKTLTHLPPFMGIMFSLGVVWVATEIMHGKKLDIEKEKYSALHALRKIDMPSVLFFLGILLAVAALQDAGHLLAMSQWMSDTLHNTFAINVGIGLLSAVVDNVPLVAAAMGMYDIAPPGTTDVWLSQFVQDGVFWEFLAYCAGTGGSILIIGSAAGVAAMGLEKISFGWYVKHISLLALAGYIGGAVVYIAMH
jgi:Na+/H+ antiporter NhaD/arsenite permease-like protein